MTDPTNPTNPTNPTDPGGSAQRARRRRSGNSTNVSRAARRLAAEEGISYMAARERVLATRAAAHTAAHGTQALDTPPAAVLTVPHRYTVRIFDGIGHSVDQWAFGLLWEEMAAAVAANPAAEVWEGETWTLTPAPGAPAVTFADVDGRFTLWDGSLGNPGCDECGSLDATVRLGRSYLCGPAAEAAGLGVCCAHCGGLVATPSVAVHNRGCPEHPEADADRERVRSCAGGPHLGDATYPEGEAFCGSCGAQFTDPEHGADL